MQFALNHMTVPGLRFDALLALAKRLGCMGVEVRDDLQVDLFDGMTAVEARAMAQSAGLQIIALAELSAFNAISDQKLEEARFLMALAKASGANGISLIPRNDGQRLAPKERQDDLRLALRELAPLLEEFGLIGFVEPLGFESCALRDKGFVIEDIEAVSGMDRFQLIHDTFHHHLAGGGPVYADHTAIVHISGVAEPLMPSQMTDAHRMLVDQDDTLGNLDQLRAFQAQRFDGPISMEAFAASVHDFSDPEAQLSRSFTFITQSLAADAA